MGKEDETDRTLFVRNLESRVTEELLFELFLQAGPVIKTKIPKDTDGKQKTFGFVVYKHEISLPYAIRLLDGTQLFEKNIHVQFRSVYLTIEAVDSQIHCPDDNFKPLIQSGSSHSNNSGNSQNSSPADTPSPHGQSTPISPPPPGPPFSLNRSLSSPDTLQKHAMMNNMMWQLQRQQLDALNNAFTDPRSWQHSPAGGGGQRYQDNAPYRPHPSQMSRSHPYSDGSARHQHHSWENNQYHQKERNANRHHNSKGGHRRYEERGNNSGHRDNRWRQY